MKLKKNPPSSILLQCRNLCYFYNFQMPMTLVCHLCVPQAMTCAFNIYPRSYIPNYNIMYLPHDHINIMCLPHDLPYNNVSLSKWERNLECEFRGHLRKE